MDLFPTGTGDKKGLKIKIDSVGIFVQNMEQMVAFYRDVIGFNMKWDGIGPFAESQNFGIHLMLYERKELASYLGVEPSYPDSPERINGSFELAIDLPYYTDVDNEFNRVVKAGAVPVVEPRDEPWGMRTSFVADPEGNLVEIGSWNKRLVEVLPYTTTWVEDFQLESRLLAILLEKEMEKIHHIGSTAVPGLAAKPIIDILIEVKNISTIDTYNQKLKGIGYKALGEYGIPERRFFRKGYPVRSHHIHIFQTGSSQVARHLAFRDYLKAHPETAARYGELKIKIADECRNDIDRYCELKNNFVAEQEALALKWYNAQEIKGE